MKIPLKSRVETGSPLAKMVSTGKVEPEHAVVVGKYLKKNEARQLIYAKCIGTMDTRFKLKNGWQRSG